MSRGATKAIAALRSGELKKFDPKHFDLRDKARDLKIDEWARLKQWDQLEREVNQKIEDIEAFCAWWNATVRRRGNQPNVVERRHLSVDDIKRDTGVIKQTVAEWKKELLQKDKFQRKIILATYRKAKLEAAENHRAEGTGENEWYTPLKYIEAAREVMGGIDLDPASSEAAQRDIKAEIFFTKKRNGLAQPWAGRVWLNPPYTQPDISNFVCKLVAEIDGGRVTDAILLTHNYTDTEWFHRAESKAALICFTRGRIKFVDSDGEECAPTQGQAFFYYGPNREKFTEIFKQFGFIR